MKIQVVKLYKQGEWTSGWFQYNPEDKECIDKINEWCDNPNCSIKLDKTETID